jgi:hypothetical protein
MGQIDAPLGEIDSVGGAIAALSGRLDAVAGATNLGGRVSEPPATSAALDALAQRWVAAAQRVEHEIETLGVATRATAVAYRAADEGSMAAAPDGGSVGTGGGGGGGGGW